MAELLFTAPFALQVLWVSRRTQDHCTIDDLSPSVVEPRREGHSKVSNLGAIWANLRQLAVLRGHLSRG